MLANAKEMMSKPAEHVTPLSEGTFAVWGNLKLPSSLPAGEYMLEARAAVVDSITGFVRVVVQSTDLTVRTE